MASLLKYIETKAEGKGADDYARIPVPEDKKRGWMSSAIIYIGCAISLSAFLLGGTLASGLTLTQAIIAVFLGTLLLAAMACICAEVAMYTGLSTPMIGKFTFGQKGAAICGLLYAMCGWGWFGVQVGLFGDTIGQMYYLITGNTMSEIGVKVVILLGGILMTSTAIIGFKSIEKLSWISIPLIGVLMIASLVVVLRGHTYGDLNTTFITSPMTLGAGISITIGSFAAGAVGSPDFLRYGKGFKDTAKAMVVGLVVGFGATIVISAFCAKAAGEANIVNIMIGLGWGMLAMLVLVLAQWTSNDNNVYCGSLGFSVVFEKIPRYKLAALIGLTGTIFAVLGISNKLIWFFSILGIFTPPIGGCYVADFYLCKRYYNFENLKNVPAIRKETMFAYFLASGFGFLTTAPPTGFGLFDVTTIPALDTFIAAFILQLILVKLLNKDFCKGPEYINK
jgi:cytosine permease